MKQQAFVLRISPSGIDRLTDGITSNQLIIGWADAKGLLDEKLSYTEFREIIRKRYYDHEENLRKAGAATGNMWRFIREMKKGDLVVVPHGSDFYVAEISGEALYDEAKKADDTAYRRPVNWLNNKQPISRSIAKSALVSRMKTQGTCTSATDLIEEIEECLEIAKEGNKPTFYSGLENRLIRETLTEIRTGRIDSFGFENLIRDVLEALGATEARIIPRSKDKGADIVATFLIAGAIPQVLAVQAKHWKPEPPVGAEVVQQLIKGIEAEEANLGMIVTSGTISDEAFDVAEKYFEEKNIRIELIDGEQFAKLVIESGLGELTPR